MKLYPANILSRVAAFLVDMIFIALFMGTIGSLSAGLLGFINDDVALVGLIILAFAILFYQPIAESLLSGQTLGKLMVGIRVVRTDGSPASVAHIFQRYLMLFVDLGMTMGMGALLVALVTKRNQRLGDVVADTVVVKTNPQYETSAELYSIDSSQLSKQALDIYYRANANSRRKLKNLEVSHMYRSLECDIAQLRTQKGHPALIEYLQRQLSATHLMMFRHNYYSVADLLAIGLRAVPRAVYQARWAVLASLIICIVGYAAGMISQYTDTGFFRDFMGEDYYLLTVENINSGNPMGVYGQQSELPMFLSIFTNNLLVSLRLYALGVFVFIGPLLELLRNFVMMGTFDAFFFQQGCAADALITPNEHGVLELSSIVMVGGAALWLGCGWLWPGRLSRYRALVRCAHQSILIVISTIPMLFVAAFIEGFITRHTEWPMPVKLIIVISTFIIIVAYYVVLPYIAKRSPAVA